MSLSAQDLHRSATPPAQDPHRATPPPTQDPYVQDNTGKRSPYTGKRSPSPPAEDPHSHPSIEQSELLSSTNRETPESLLSTQQSDYVASKDSLSSGFYVFG
jgi:hypothetical protein